MLEEFFNSGEKEQYARHFSIKNFGIEGQKRLKTGKVLVVGAGGLGCPVLMYLVAAGVGTIGIVEYDRIENSNLHRQLLFSHEDIGLFKGAVAKEKLRANNPHVKIEHFNTLLSEANILDYVAQYDIIVDATDNFTAKYLLNDACFIKGKPLIYASISQFEGQIAVFNLPDGEGSYSSNLRDIFPEPPPIEISQNCGEAGVLGVLPGIIGSMQALEVIKILAKCGTPLTNKIILFDALNMDMRKVSIRRRKNNPLSGESPSIVAPLAIEATCVLSTGLEQYAISPQELELILQSNKSVQLIDVRDTHEHQQSSLGGLNIPLHLLNAEDLHYLKGIETIIYCKSGTRSLKALNAIQSTIGEDSCRSLAGGMDAYIAAGCQERLLTNRVINE